MPLSSSTERLTTKVYVSFGIVSPPFRKLRSLMVWSHLSFSTALCKLVVSTELFRSKPQVHSFLPRREDKKRFRMSSCGFSASELSSIVLFIEVQPLFSPKPLPNFPSLCYTTPVHQHQKGQRRVEVL